MCICVLTKTNHQIKMTKCLHVCFSRTLVTYRVPYYIARDDRELRLVSIPLHSDLGIRTVSRRMCDCNILAIFADLAFLGGRMYVPHKKYYYCKMYLFVRDPSILITVAFQLSAIV